jgi:hypothetical protein
MTKLAYLDLILGAFVVNLRTNWALPSSNLLEYSPFNAKSEGLSVDTITDIFSLASDTRFPAKSNALIVNPNVSPGINRILDPSNLSCRKSPADRTKGSLNTNLDAEEAVSNDELARFL